MPLLDTVTPGLIRAGALTTLSSATNSIRSVTLQPLSHCEHVVKPVRLFRSTQTAAEAKRDLMDPDTHAFYKGTASPLLDGVTSP